MDMLEMARDELRRSAVLTPPESYRGRLICQMVLASLLVIQCAIYLMIWVRDARRAGKSLNIFHIQRTQGGSMITVQALCAYIICTLMTGIVMIVHRCQLYVKYYRDGTPRNMAAVHLLYMTTTSFGTLAYTFANFNSTLLILRRSTSFESTGRTWLYIYNAFFVISIFGWLAAVIYIGIILNPEMYNLYYISKTTLETVEMILEDPSKLTGEMIGPLMSLEKVLPETGAIVASKCKEMIMLAIIYSSFYALAGAFSLVFVWTLRKHTRQSRPWIHGSFPSTSVIAASSQNTARTAATSDSTDTQATAVAKPVKKKQQHVIPQDRQHAALERLVADLTLSVPVVLLLSLYYPIAGGVAIANFYSTGWANQEYQNDIFCWPTVTMNNIIVAYFIWNSWKAPGRYGAGHDRNNVASDTPSGLSTSKTSHNNIATAKRVLQKQRHVSIEVHELKTIHISCDKDGEFISSSSGGKEGVAVAGAGAGGGLIADDEVDSLDSQRDIEIIEVDRRW